MPPRGIGRTISIPRVPPPAIHVLPLRGTSSGGGRLNKRYDRVVRTLKLRRPKYKHDGDARPHPVYEIPETIDIANLRQSMGGLYVYLERCYDGILDWWDAGQHGTD